MTRAGDIPDCDRLLDDAEWLRALAARLVGHRDAHAADDLVQDAVVARLGSGGRGGPAPGSERAWLRRVAVNLVRQSFRRKARRRAREAAVAESRSAPPASDVVSRAQTHRLLVDAVLALDEPFRSTLLRRFFDHEEPAAIAAADGVPAATVRSRLHRGLAQLRARLTARHGGRREDWIGGVAALAAPDAAATLAPAIGGGALVATGVTLMPKLTLAAAVVVALATAIWFFVPHDAPRPRARDDAATTTQPAETRGRDGAAVRGAADPPPADPVAAGSATPTAPVAAATLTVITTGAGRARAGVAVAFQRASYPADAGNRHLRREGDRIAVLVGDRATFEGLAPGRWHVAVLEGDTVLAQKQRDLTAGREAELTFPLGDAAIAGIVRDPNGDPLAGWLVRCSLLDADAWRSDTRTDARGRYRFEAVPRGTAWLGVYPDDDFARPPRFMREFEVSSTAVHAVDFGSAGRAAIWRGALRNRLGQRVPGQEVDFGHGRLRLQSADGERRTVPLARDGTFEVALTPGVWQIRAKAPSQRGSTPLAEPIRIGARDLQLDLDLPWRRVGGRLLDRETDSSMRGEQLAALRVELWHTTAESGARLLGAHPVDPLSGTFLFDAVEPGAGYELRCGGIGATAPFELGADTDRLAVDLRGRLPR